MAYAPLTKIPQQFFDNLGNPLVSGTLYAYLAGTSTPTNMFSDNAGTVAGTSVVLDSRGEPTTFKLIWLNTAVIYKFVLKDSTGTTIWTIDNISGDDGTGNTASSVFDQQTLTATAGQTLFTLGYSYVTGTNAMAVYKNGARLITGTDFTETSSTSVTLTMAAIAGDEYTFIGGQDVSSSFSGTNVSFIQAGTGAVVQSIQTKLQTGVDVSVFDFMNATQIATVQAYSFSTDVTTACQSALDAAHAANKNLYFPAGGYLVTGLTIPGTVNGVGTDDRNKGFRIYGQGFGEPFVHLNTGGTVIKSVTDAPVLQDILGTASSSNGTIEIDHIRFDGTSNATPVVRLQSFYGLSSFHNCVIYQRGTGDGLRLGWGATVSVRECYVMNKDWATYSLGAARVGTGIAYIPTADNGLVTISKCTSRGWSTAYQIAGGAGAAYSACIDKCEGSVIYNGVILQSNADKCIVSNCYFEGGEGGVGINNLGDYNTIQDNLFFAGFATAIQDLGTSNKGTLIEGNLIGIGATISGKGIDIASSAAFGGYNKNVINNSITYTAGTDGVKGIALSGTDPRVTILGNMFDPRGNWTGINTEKFDDNSTNGAYGIVQKQLVDLEIPVLSHGAIALEQGPSALTQANVAANVLTIPEVGSYFVCNASAPCTVQSINAGVTPGRVVVFRTDTANMTFQDTAFIVLNGNFTGPGTLTLIIDRIGASNYAYELCRTVF
jgi:hypothetical protein